MLLIAVTRPMRRDSSDDMQMLITSPGLKLSRSTAGLLMTAFSPADIIPSSLHINLDYLVVQPSLPVVRATIKVNGKHRILGTRRPQTLST